MPKTMTSRERFAATMAYEPTDRPAMDYYAHPVTNRRLKEYLGVKTERELLDNLGCDFYHMEGRCLSQNEFILKCWKKGQAPAPTDTERTCPLGIRYQRLAFDGKFAVDEALAAPLANATTPREILDHPWPRAKDFDFTPWREECQAHADRVVVGGLNTAFFSNSFRMIGFERFLLSLAADPEFTRTLLDRMVDMYLELNDAAFTALNGTVDVYMFGADYGSQESLLMSRQMWLDYFFENTKRICAHAHSHGLKVMMHSCGAIFELIGDLIDAGVDMLDPIQLTAKGMGMDRLTEHFGGRIVFHGGIDTQHVLPEGTPDQVRTHAREVIDGLSAKGGYIFCPSQILSPDISDENIEAMYRTCAPK